MDNKCTQTPCTYKNIYIPFFCTASEETKALIGVFNGIDVISNTIRNHMDNVVVCGNGLIAIKIITQENSDNQKLTGKSRCIELIRDVIRKYMYIDDVCRNGLTAIKIITQENSDNQKLACELGCLELVRDAIRENKGNSELCIDGLLAINNIVYGNAYSIKRACELGFVDFMLEIIEYNKDDKSIAEWCCRCLTRLLSTQETHAKWCTEDVLKKVEECQARFKDSLLIKKCLACLKREEDPRVADAVERGVCIKETTSCGKEDCPREESNCLCIECATPQKCFQCFECQGSPVCCEVCMKGKHSGHQGAEFFDIITYC